MWSKVYKYCSKLSSCCRFWKEKIFEFFYLSCLLSSSFWSYDEWQYYNILQCHRVTPICYYSFISQGLYYFHLVKMSEVIFDQIGLSDPNEGCFTLNSSNLVQFFICINLKQCLNLFWDYSKTFHILQPMTKNKAK